MLARFRSSAWLAFALVGLLYMQSQFHRIAPASLSQVLAHDLALSSTALGSLAAMYFYVYMALQLPAGLVADRWGPRPLIVWGGLLAVLGSLLFASSASFTGLMLGRALIGIGVAGFFVAYLKLVALLFPPQRFSSLVGWVILLGNIGALSATEPLAAVLTWCSWRQLFYALAGLTLLLVLLAWRGVPAERLPAHGQAVWPGLKAVMKNPATWPPFIACGGLSGSFLTFAGLWATPWLQSQAGATPAQAGRHGLLLIAVFAVVSCGLGWLTDRFGGRKKPWLVALGALFVLVWGLLWVLPPQLGWASYGLFALLGLSAPAFTLTWALAKEVNPPALSGVATSLVNAAPFAVVGLLQPVIGAVLDHYGRNACGFGVALLLLGATGAVGWLAGLAVRESPRAALR